ncbi:MAG: hypothetical protein ABSE68_02430 [Minisyncoccia bacterium]
MRFLSVKLDLLKDSTYVKCGGKAFAAFAALGFLIATGVSFWPVTIFLIILGTIYFSESAERKSLRMSFWFTVFSGIFGAAAIPALPPGFLFYLISFLTALMFGGLIFLVLGVTNLVFRHRFVVFNILNTALAACLFLLLFYFKPDFLSGVFPVVFWFLAVFWVAGLLMKEVLVFGDPLSRGRNLRIITWTFGFLTAELAALCAFLPFGFINSTAFLTLLYILGRDVILARLRGFLDVPLVLRELAILAVFASIVFATVAWTIP